MTRDEKIKHGIILLAAAEECFDEALMEVPHGLRRTFPFPETRQHLGSLRRLRRSLEHNWNCVWNRKI